MFLWTFQSKLSARIHCHILCLGEETTYADGSESLLLTTVSRPVPW